MPKVDKLISRTEFRRSSSYGVWRPHTNQQKSMASCEESLWNKAIYGKVMIAESDGL